MIPRRKRHERFRIAFRSVKLLCSYQSLADLHHCLTAHSPPKHVLVGDECSIVVEQEDPLPKPMALVIALRAAARPVEPTITARVAPSRLR